MKITDYFRQNDVVEWVKLLPNGKISYCAGVIISITGSNATIQLPDGTIEVISLHELTVTGPSERKSEFDQMVAEVRAQNDLMRQGKDIDL